MQADAPEAAQHIKAGCQIHAGKAYMEHHNQMTGMMYRNICVNGLEVLESKRDTKGSGD